MAPLPVTHHRVGLARNEADEKAGSADVVGARGERGWSRDGRAHLDQQD